MKDANQFRNLPEEKKDEMLYYIWDALYPDGDMDHEWSSDELEKIAGVFEDAGT